MIKITTEKSKAAPRSHYRSQTALFAVVLIILLLIRGITLDSIDLLDPTETRYATIAHEMISSGDWITPRLPTPNGLELYMSKPPLHFWLTALSYKFFGVDEWTSRLPSFLGLLLMILSVVIFAQHHGLKKIGYMAGLICVSSPLLFFLAASSTVDVTFAAFISAALVCYAIFIGERSSATSISIARWLFFVLAALAFLTKGPSALVLIGIPIILLCIFERSLAPILSLPLLRGALLFLAIVAPWFVLIEQAHPGSVWYYFVNENFLRFLVTQYGGNHGAAHVRPYGSIWWMWLLSMLPWSLFFMHKLYARWQNGKFHFHRWEVFCLAWGLSPMLFFTFARSILPAYILPGIPGIALFLASLLEDSLPQNTNSISKKFAWFQNPRTIGTSLSMSAVMLSIIFIAGPTVGERKSSEEILELIAETSRANKPLVGTVSKRNISPYWIARAYEGELTKPITVEYANEEHVKKAHYRHLIVRDKGNKDFLLANKHNYEKVTSRGHWSWYRKK